MTYSEKLKDQRWQKKRLELLAAANWKCQQGYCQNENPNATLHVHHKVYLRKTDPWDYEDWAYSVLCDECHEREQLAMEAVHGLLAKHEQLMSALWWLSRTDEASQSSISESLNTLTSLSPEYVAPLSSLLTSVAAFRMEIIGAARANGQANGEADKAVAS